MNTIHNDSGKPSTKKELIAQLDHALALALELNRQIDDLIASL